MVAKHAAPRQRRYRRQQQQRCQTPHSGHDIPRKNSGATSTDVTVASVAATGGSNADRPRWFHRAEILYQMPWSANMTPTEPGRLKFEAKTAIESAQIGQKSGDFDPRSGARHPCPGVVQGTKPATPGSAAPAAP
jgi:hypothetical protein